MPDLTHNDPVRTFVRRPPVEVLQHATLRSVAETLTEEVVGVALVQGTNPPGLVSERDLAAALADGADPDQARALDVMTEDLASATPHERILDVARRMLDNEIRHLPVVEDGAVVGVLSARDVLGVLVDEIDRTHSAA